MNHCYYLFDRIKLILIENLVAVINYTFHRLLQTDQFRLIKFILFIAKFHVHGWLMNFSGARRQMIPLFINKRVACGAPA